MKNVSATLAIALVFGAALAAQAERQSTIIQKIIVKVNGEILTQTDLEQRQIEAVRARPDAAQIATNAQLEQVITEITPAVLVSAVDEMLLLARGKELGYRLSQEQFERVVDNVKTQNNLDDAQLEVALQQEGMTMQDYRQMIERQLIIEQVQSQEVLGATSLTEAEMRQYYREHPDEFMEPATVTLREVFVAVPGRMQAGEPVVNVAEEEAARARINAARDRILKGEDVAAIVEEVSESPSKANGGLIGPINLADLAPALRSTVEGLDAGDVSTPVRSQTGYQIFKMEARTESTVSAFDDVRDEIQQGILRERVEAETQKYLERMMDQAVIEWKDDTYRRLYDQGIERRKSGGA